MPIELLPLTQQSPYFDQAVAVYSECMPTIDNRFYQHFFLNQMARDGYVGLCARLDTQIVGIAFGSHSVKGQWWHDRVIRYIDETHPSLQQAWLFTQFNVLSAYRNQGIGQHLHDAILCLQPSINVILSTQRTNTRAQRFYQRYGWRLLVNDVIFASGDEPYAIFHQHLAKLDQNSVQLHPAGD